MDSALRGTPALRREKRYAADSGYVYHYYYCGQRSAQGGTEYVFDVSSDGRGFLSVSVVLSEQALVRWQSCHARDLAATERYAIAKISLLRAFDQCPRPSEMQRAVLVSAADAAEILGTLGID